MCVEATTSETLTPWQNVGSTPTAPHPVKFPAHMPGRQQIMAQVVFVPPAWETWADS